MPRPLCPRCGSPGIVLETALLGNPQSESVFFGGQRVARRDVSGVQSLEYYYFSNQIHSTALIQHTPILP